MDVLNSIALPQSTEHFHLLLVVYNIVSVFLLPYLALLLGGMITAVYLDRRGQRLNDPTLGKLARRLTGVALPGVSPFIFFAALPMLVVLFVFAQVFQTTSAVAPGSAGLAFLFLIAGGTSGFLFKFTFTVDDVITLAGSPGGKSSHGAPPQAVADFVTSARASHKRSGSWGVGLLVLSTILLIAASTVGMNPGWWWSGSSLLSVFISGQFLLNLLVFAGLSVAITGSALLFTYYVWNPDGNVDPSEEALVRTTGIRLAVWGLLLAPASIALSMGVMPQSSQTGTVYVFVALAVLDLGLGLLLLYAFVQSGKRLYVSLLLSVVVFSSALWVTKDRIAMHTATADHAAMLASVYDHEAESLRISLGVVGKRLTGEDIFNAKCSACHMFDQKKVGPPYNVVLKKYDGRKSALVSFVLNPSKVDPAFPSMPAQGLKPAEADSIATYLLLKVTGKPQ
jgi:cytochrome c551/c552